MAISQSVRYHKEYYGAINITDETYFADPGINCSSLKTIRSMSGYHWHIFEKVNFKKDTEAFRLGTLIHALILGTPNIEAFTCYDGASKDSKKYRDWLADEAREGVNSCDVVLEREMEKAKKIYKYAFEQNGLISELQTTCQHKEVAAFYSKCGYRAKAKADALCLMGGDEDGIIWDVKTTNDLFKFPRDAREFGYHMQDSWYREIFSGALQSRFGYRLLVIEKNYPYSVVHYDFSDRVLSQGRRWINEAFAEYCVGLDTGVWRKPNTNITLDWGY